MFHVINCTDNLSSIHTHIYKIKEHKTLFLFDGKIAKIGKFIILLRYHSTKNNPNAISVGTMSQD